MLWRLFLGFSATIAVLLIGEYAFPSPHDIRAAKAFWTNEHFAHKNTLADVDLQITRDCGTELTAKNSPHNTFPKLPSCKMAYRYFEAAASKYR